jgi:hypothetical protein
VSAHPALAEAVEQLDAAIRAQELGDCEMYELVRRARRALGDGATAEVPRVDVERPCPDCGSTDDGHATPCGRVSIERAAAESGDGLRSMRVPAGYPARRRR